MVFFLTRNNIALVANSQDTDRNSAYLTQVCTLPDFIWRIRLTPLYPVWSPVKYTHKNVDTLSELFKHINIITLSSEPLSPQKPSLSFRFSDFFNIGDPRTFMYITNLTLPKQETLYHILHKCRLETSNTFALKKNPKKWKQLFYTLLENYEFAVQRYSWFLKQMIILIFKIVVKIQDVITLKFTDYYQI